MAGGLWRPPFEGTHQTRGVADLVDRLWWSITGSAWQRQGAR